MGEHIRGFRAFMLKAMMGATGRSADPTQGRWLDCHAMRVMHISTRLILGGSQENTVLSCEGQVSPPWNHAVSLVYGPIYGPEGSMLERVRAFRSPTGAAIEAIETPNLVREISPRRDWKCRRELRALIRAWKPDVVHTHSSKAGILGRAAAWDEGVGCVVHTVHGPPFHRFEKWWRNKVYIAAERWAAKRCHRIVCVADAMREQFLAAGIGRPEQYVTVYSGMEIEPFTQPKWTRAAVRAELGLDEHDFVLGTIARLAELKGHDDLLDGLGSLMQEEPRLKLLWVGDGWWRERLMERVVTMGLKGRVILTGLVPPEQVPKYVQAMDGLAHPSYREGLPRAVPQAMLSGVPVVAYDVDGTKEVCKELDTGRLVTVGDVRGLESAVRWMITEPGEARQMALRARELCEQRFAAQRMVEQLEQVYRGS